MRKDKEQLAFAQKLREQQTDAERALWYRLRNSQLAGMKFRRQQPIGPYIVDFVTYDRLLIVEVDGAQHAEKDADRERTRYLEGRGYQVLRFWNNEVLANTEGVLESIMESLTGASPSP